MPDCEHAEHDGAGCLGYAGCTQDDEPIDVCKYCKDYTGNVVAMRESCEQCDHYYEDQSEYHWCHMCDMEHDCYKEK